MAIKLMIYFVFSVILVIQPALPSIAVDMGYFDNRSLPNMIISMVLALIWQMTIYVRSICK